MNPIKIILAIPLLLVIIGFLKSTKSKTYFSFFLFLLAIIGLILISFPELTTKVANLLGVGRGVDLLFYACILIFFVISMMLYKKIRTIEIIQTKIIRNLALQNAQKLNNPDENISKNN